MTRNLKIKRREEKEGLGKVDGLDVVEVWV